MFRPVLATPATVLPVTVEEVKSSLRIDGDDLDSEIESAIKSAVAHYEGWNGKLGISLVEQTWRVSFGRFERSMFLPLRPVQRITSVDWKDIDGVSAPVTPAEYLLQSDAGGTYFARFFDAYVFPTSLYETSPISIDYVAGWPLKDGKATTPEDIKSAIKMRVQMQIDEAATANREHLKDFERELVSKYKPPRI
ncbi:phage head-tail connector protein [Neorhizobium sp. T786]|uniref:head-tail connector protein n=1 Tax=Pseudorhizobium xiangyangii TaxID=2883104 RepID=UPI001CFFE489|nr:phage head-tail connector protein [Neorhizobium xiangyangii]MCB5201891.1 phage head-tail connector protein [Neorhizobium xiangyangii]